VKRNKLFAVAMVLFLLVGTLGCSSQSQSGSGDSKDNPKQPYKIGLLIPMSGDAGDHGQIMIDGAKIAQEEINAAGGILGRQVELIPFDSAANTEKGVTGAKKLIEQDKVDALVGTYRTGVALAVMDVAADAKIPFLISMAASDEIRNKIGKDNSYYKYVFKVAPDVADYTANLLPFLTDITKAKTYYYAAENTAWAKQLGSVMKKQAEAAGIKLVGEAYVDTSATEFTATIMDIKKANPDVVVCGIITAPGVPFAKQYYDAKVPVPMVVTSGVLTIPNTIKNMGAQSDYISFGLFNIDKPITDLTVPFWEKFQEKYGYRGTGFNEVKTYDSIRILAEAINKAGSFDKDALAKTLETEQFKGLAGTYKFDETDHQAKWGEGYVNGVLAEWKDGKAQVIWPENVRDSALIRAPWWK